MHTIQFKFVNNVLSSEEKQILMPSQKSSLASGFDLASAAKEDLHLAPQERILVPTGIAISISLGFEGQIRSRSGLALNHGVIVPNAPGTIDADYRGEIKIILANISCEPFVVTFGMRIAQLVIAPVLMPEMVEVLRLDDSLRGEAGFGSTGLF